MTLNLTIVEEGDDLDPLARTVADIHPALSRVAGGLEVPSTEVTVILTTDLRNSVRSRAGHADFEVERIAGGRVTGKTLPVVPDYSTVNVFLDASRYLETADGSGLAEAVYLLAHEYGHVLHGRLRHAIAPAPMRWEPTGIARLLVIQAVEELRCDMLADLVLRCTARLQPDSREPETAATAWDLLRDSHTVSLGHVLDNIVHPGWPDLVDSYRHGEIDLISMWNQLTSETQQVLHLLAHAQALAINGQRDNPLTVHQDHPAVKLYLGPAWESIAEVIDGRGFLPELAKFAKDENEIATAGSKGVLEMWAKLGITSVVMEGPDYELKVRKPAR